MLVQKMEYQHHTGSHLLSGWTLIKQNLRLDHPNRSKLFVPSRYVDSSILQHVHHLLIYR